MKDTIITGRRKKIELITMLICFLIANIANIYSIIAYKTSFTEIFTSMGYVIVAAAALYVLWSIIRLVIYGISFLFRKKD